MEDALHLSADLGSVDEAAFRAACGQFPTGVTVITALDQKRQPIGLTANSFASVALTPPTVLWSVGPQSRSFESFIETKFYAVHVLHKTQKDLAELFASRDNDKFSGLNWVSGAEGLPILQDVAVCLECQVIDVCPCGNQRLMIGRVFNIRPGRTDGALIYFQSRFSQIDRLP